MINERQGKFVFSSSVNDDVWHENKPPKAYEWWYFDAISDDGNEAIVIVFLDNFIYSPRYNRQQRVDDGERKKFPAVSFSYLRNGKTEIRSVIEYSEENFNADHERPHCKIGECSFEYLKASYGTGYLLEIKCELSGGRRVEAKLEWLDVESNMMTVPLVQNPSHHFWNMVSPRADVSGRITLLDNADKPLNVSHFRGTGYHDHNIDDRWMAKTIQDWHWGRVHLPDSTAVFCRYKELDDEEPETRLMTVKNGLITDHVIISQEQEYIRDAIGIKYPQKLLIKAENDVEMKIVPILTIDSSFFYMRFLSEIIVKIDDHEHTGRGLTEFLSPSALKYRWLNWLYDMRTGRDGKRPLIP